ncbi:alpha/beta hydrolase family protein [Pseudomonas protegens]|uniref:alpha/beta hydrolase family protein n=1 Tax=Pseudomonas protegens TaxID=380021 RepID=UPI002280B868|nr:alpha/beta fold hydrolase [Pseudomonas protegens]MCY7262544.1 alpha/beta fold hydrolase [Pseudomonas protegens]
MRKFALSAWMLAGLCLHLPLVHAAELIGFREVTLADASQQRPLHVALWYPTTTTAPLLPSAANPIFQGVATIKDAAPSGSAHPLVVLSHGYRGNWRNLSWLVSSLVDQGYIVAAPDHPGTTTFDQRPAEAAKLWERPRDLSRVIDKLTLDNTLAGPVDPQRIAAIGHSLGGWTVTALAGARYSPQRYLEECRLHPNPRLCQIAPELGITAHNQGALSADLRDPRVKAVVALDLGFARGFTPESLSTLHTPVLVLGAGVNIADMPVEEESGYLNAHLASPPSRYEVLANASHFSFMQVCKPGAVALLKEEAPGDEIICRDGDAGDRQDIHRRVAKLIGDFLDQKLAGQPPAG